MQISTLKSEWAPFEDTLGDVLNSFTTIVFDETLYVFGKSELNWKYCLIK
jgi:hypothetical protein